MREIATLLHFTIYKRQQERQHGGIAKIVAFLLPIRSLTLPILALEWWCEELSTVAHVEPAAMALGTVAKKDDLSVDHRGQYNRRIGRIPGDPNQPRFTFGRVEKWEALRRKIKVEAICSADGGVWNSASLAIARAVSKGLDCVELDPEEHDDLLPSAEAARLAEMPAPSCGSGSLPRSTA